MKIIVATLLFATVVTAQFPSFIQRCKRDSGLNECIKNNINGVKGQFKNGIPSLLIPKSDPLVIDPELVVLAPTLKITHRKGFIYSGIDTFNIQNVNLDLNNNSLQLQWVWDNTVAQGTYKFEGKLLQFEVNGGGECLVKADNLGILLTMTGERKQKEDKNYIIFKKNDVKLLLDKLTASIYFGNLFPTAEETEKVNKLMNENQQATINEFQPVIEKTTVAVITNAIQKLFEKYSIEELFPL